MEGHLDGWIDAHCHLADPRLAADVEGVIGRSRAAGVRAWIQGGVSPEDWARQEELRVRFGTGVVVSRGLHPGWVAQATEAEVDSGLSLLQSSPPYILGEVGLDHSMRYDTQRPLQRRAFEAQAAMAAKGSIPLVLHVVRAHGEALEILDAQGPFPGGGLVHQFSGPIEIARGYRALGFVISVGPTLLREGYTALKRTLTELAPEDLVLETDSPDGMAEPAGLRQVAEEAGRRLGVAPDELLATSTRSLKRLFRLDTLS